MNRIFKYALMLCFIGIAIFALSQVSGEVAADTHVWDGGGVDNNASTATNWENDTVPVTSDQAIFPAGTKDCIWDFTTIYQFGIEIRGTMFNFTYIGTGLNLNKLINAGYIYINNNDALIFSDYTGNTYTNTGTINSAANEYMTFWYHNADPTRIYGNVENLNICGHSELGANRIVSLGADTTVTKLKVDSQSDTYTMTMDANDYKINCAYNFISTRGVILGGNDELSCSKDWDDTNGTFIPETGTVILSGTGYCHTDDPGTFYNLQLEGTTRFVHAVTTTAFTANGQWTGRVYYNGTNDISTDQQHWTGWLYTQNDIAIEYNAYAYLAFNHDDWLGIQLESWSGTDNFTWNATSVASQTVQWSWSRGESNAMYDEYQDTIYIGSSETNAGGMGTFTSTFVGSHAFLLSRSTFLPASTDIDDSVWLGILFMCIATIINFVGYVRKIGLLQIVSFLVLLVGIFAATDVWEELWTLPTLFVLTNAVIFIIGMIRRG